MNDQTNMAQLRYLEELKISLVHAGFEPERIEDQHLPVRWENHYLCRVSGRGSVPYRQENVDGIGAQDALQTVINTAAMTAEYMTAMERAPKLQATGLEGDYRILADFGDAVLAGHPSERGVQFVTWEWDWDREGVHHGHYFQNGYEEAKHDFVRRSGLLPGKHCSSQNNSTRYIGHWLSFANRTRTCPSEGKRRSRPSWSRSSAYCRNLRNRRRQWNKVCKRCRSFDAAVFVGGTTR